MPLRLDIAAQITTSSFSSAQHAAYFGHLLSDSYWKPHPSDDSPWIQVSFGQRVVLSGLVIDGQLSLDIGWIWVDRFYVTYSDGGIAWKPYVYFTEEELVRCHQYPHKFQTYMHNIVSRRKLMSGYL